MLLCALLPPLRPPGQSAPAHRARGSAAPRAHLAPAQPLRRAPAPQPHASSPPEPTQADGGAVRRARADPALSRHALLSGVAAMASFLVAAPVARASFGPAVGSVDSPPKLPLLDLEAWLSLKPEKVRQRAGTVPRSRLRNLREQIDSAFSPANLEQLIVKLEDEVPSPAIATELERLREQLRRGAKAQRLAQQLREREEQAAKLDAQPPLIVYGAAFVASSVSTSIMHPVDTFKTLQQARASNQGEAAHLAGDDDSLQGAASGTLTRLPPLRELYRGLLPNLAKEGPSSALYLGVYESCKAKLLLSPLGASPLAVYLAAGAAGEFVGSIARAPAEAAKARLQSGLASKTGEALTQVLLEKEGRDRTFRAWSVSLLRDVPMGAAQLAVFELLKSAAVQSPSIEVDVSSPAAEALFGAVGGMVGALISVPADVVTTRINTQEGEDRTDVISVAQQMLAEEGPSAFFKGATTRVLYWTPAIGIFLSLYCSLRQLTL